MVLAPRTALTALIALALSSCGAGAQSARSDNAIPRAGQPIDCPSEGPALQILGSGGPIAEGGDAARAGTSYLLWIDGAPRLLVDAGSGSFLRFAQVGGSIATLDAIVLTHLHADHAGDLIDILNSGGFENRTKPLTIVGPAGAPRFAGIEEFTKRLLSKESGAFAYNGGYIDGDEAKPLLEFVELSADQTSFEMRRAVEAEEYFVAGWPVAHGFSPALGVQLHFFGREARKDTLITGDQSAGSFMFQTAFEGAKPHYLFAHHVIPMGEGQPRGLHRNPAEIGTLAAALEPENLVLTHNMQRSLQRLDEGLEAIGAHYQGPVSVADDLDCYAL